MKYSLRSALSAIALCILGSSQAVVDLYVVSEGSRNLIRFNGSTGAFKETLVPASSGILQRPHDMIFGGPSQNFYIADGGRSAVVEVNARTGALVRTFSNGSLGECWGVDFAPNGNILTFGANSNAVHEFNVTTGAYLGTFIAPGSGGLNNTRGAVFGPANDFYVTGGSPNSQIRKYNATTGAYVSLWGNTVNWGDLNDLVFGPDGNLFVLDRGFSTHNIHKLNGTTGATLGVFVSQGQGGMSDPRDLVFGSNGNLFVADQGTNQIYQFSGTTGLFINIFASGAGMNSVNSLVFADPGDTTFATSYTITSGDYFGGNLASLANFDNDYLSLTSEASTYRGRIEIGATSPTTTPTHFAIAWESRVVREGLVETVELRNYSGNTWVLVSGAVAPIADLRSGVVLNSNLSSYVSAAGAVRCRIRWELINDEDPSQDGWVLYLDEVTWTIH